MKKIKKTIILTARDISAANALINFRDLLKKKYKIIVYCENPAYDYLKNKFKCIKFLNKKNEIDKIFNKKIHSIISGYSSKVLKNFGVDEVLVKEGNKRQILTFIFQDYPGDFNLSLKSHPKYYLVVNELAKRITKKLTKKETIVVGYAFLKRLKKNYSKSKSIKKKILIAGQPLSDLNYLKDYFRDLAKTLKIYKKKLVIFYRPHPAEEAHTQMMKKIFNKHNLKVKITQKKNLYDDLLEIDLLISVNSTIAIDYNYMNFFLKKKGYAIYYINNKKMKKIFNQINLYSKMNFAKEVNTKKQLNRLINKVTNSKLIANPLTNEFNHSESNFKDFLTKINIIINSNSI